MNKLSLWTFTYRKSYYLTHPWKWLRDVYWNIRNFWHRGRYGFAYVDVWNWCNWWPNVGAAALRYMAEHGSGYPGTEPWETPEKWREFLITQADNLDKAAKSCDFLGCDDENEYAEAFHKLHKEFKDLTVEEKILKQKYWNRTNELQNRYARWRANLFENIGRNLDRYWD